MSLDELIWDGALVSWLMVILSHFEILNPLTEIVFHGYVEIAKLLTVLN